jgi:uncharacterized protein (DUF2141 family)
MKLSSKVLLPLLALAGLGWQQPSSALPQKGDLTITITQLRNQKGQVCAKLYSDRRSFPNGDDKKFPIQCVSLTEAPASEAPASEAPVTVTFKDLPLGNYAVSLFHDENSDRTINRTGIGLPLEGFGFSRNPVIRAAPPKFGDVVVLVAGQSTKIQIQMNYYL